MKNNNLKCIDITHVAFRYKNWDLLSVNFIKRINEEKSFAVMTNEIQIHSPNEIEILRKTKNNLTLMGLVVGYN